MSWIFGENRNLFLKVKSKMRLKPVVLKSRKSSPRKLTLTVVGMQQLPDIGKTVSNAELSRKKCTIFNGRRKVCVNFKMDTDKLNIVVYRYRKNTYVKDTEMEIKLTE